MNDDVAVKVDNVSKVFKLPNEKNSSIKSAVVNVWRRNRTYEKLQALQNVSFEVKKGEFFGIVGRNGSGKSTLLKLLAGIYDPTEGSITVNGKLTPFIELGVGFNPELTGRENVFLNGALLGFNRKAVQRMYKDIVAFAELERFMNQKLKNYSSGMQVRLAFSIAIRANTDILLIDEVLAVGDQNFQKKCFDHFKQLKKSKKTVVLVSHDMGAVEEYCDRVMLINNGKVTEVGNTREVAAKYKLINLPPEESPDQAIDNKIVGDVTIDKVTINGVSEVILGGNENIAIEIAYTPKKKKNYRVGISIFRSDGNHVAYYDNGASVKEKLFPVNHQQKTVCEFSTKQLLSGAYVVDIEVYGDDLYSANKTAAVRFAIKEKNKYKGGLLNINGSWRLET